jgi:hypothetical protein
MRDFRFIRSLTRNSNQALTFCFKACRCGARGMTISAFSCLFARLPFTQQRSSGDFQKLANDGER